ncbi:MAG: PEP-CTERM sorting domain-containing protein [Phycisphaeraceae bacterium]
MKMWNAKVAMCGTVLMLAGAGVSNAATITWQSAQNIAGDTDVDTVGTLVRALNFNNLPLDPAEVGGEAPTVNGVTFADVSPSSSSWSSGAGAGDITLAVGTPSASWGNFDGFNGGAAPYTGLSDNYKSLLTSAVFKIGANQTATYTLLNLTPGTPYRVQFFVNDSRSASYAWTATDQFTAGNVSDALDVNVGNAWGKLGQYVIGTFTADAATQVISVLGSDPTNNRGIQLNAYQLREVPEPATLGLLTLGSMMIAFRGRGR